MVMWPLLHTLSPLPTDDVLVVAVDLDRTEVELTSLDEREHAQAERLRGEIQRQRYLTAHGAMRQILGWQIGVAPSRLIIEVDHFGKPMLRDHSMVFNLSHSGGWALIAMLESGAVGIDLEFGERLGEVDQLAQRVFRATELTAFNALPTPQRSAAFLTAWTRKEAALKALGLGLPGGMEHVEITEHPLRLEGDFTRLPGLAGLHLHDLPTLEGGYASVCHGPHRRAVTCGRWPTKSTTRSPLQLPSRYPS